MEDFAQRYTVKRLREVCRSLDLPTSGTKSEVVQRILDFFRQFIVPIVHGVPAEIPPNRSLRINFLRTIVRRFVGLIPRSSVAVSRPAGALNLSATSIGFGNFFRKLLIVLVIVGCLFVMNRLYSLYSDPKKLEILVNCPGFWWSSFEEIDNINREKPK